MVVRFGTVNVTNPQDPNYVTVGSKVRDRHNGTTLELAICKREPVLSRLLGAERYVFEGPPVGVLKADPATEALMRQHLGDGFSSQIQVVKYVLPLDDDQGNIHTFDKIG